MTALDGRALPCAIVIIGGEPRPEKLRRVREACGLAVEWLGNRDVARLTERVRRGGVRGIVVLEGLASHSAFGPLVRAARQGGVAVTYARRGGIAAMLVAIVRVDAARVAAPVCAPPASASATVDRRARRLSTTVSGRARRA